MKWYVYNCLYSIPTLTGEHIHLRITHKRHVCEYMFLHKKWSSPHGLSSLSFCRWGPVTPCIMCVYLCVFNALDLTTKSFYTIVWHIAYECWVCVNKYGSHNRGEGFYHHALFLVVWSWESEWTEPAPHYEEKFNKSAPSNKTILAIAEKFHCMGSVLCQRKGATGCPRTVTTNENHERLLQQVLQFPKRSLRGTSLKLGVSNRSVQQMFKELDRFAYHIQVAQRLTETGERARLQYCSRVLSMTYADPDFFINI